MADWYVRPDTSHSGTRNGTSYATAWGGWSEINGASLGATDTLYVCGTHAHAALISLPKAGTSAAARFIIDGGYSADPGAFNFTSTGYINANRDYVSLRNLSISGTATSSRIFLANTGCEFFGLTIEGAANGILFNSANGTAYADTNIERCTIYGQTNAAVQWLVTVASALSTMTRLTIRGNTMYGQTQNQVVHLRTETGVAAGSVMSGVVIEGNTIYSAQGVGIRAVHAATTAVGGSIIVANNAIRDLTEGALAIGGGIAVIGFTGVTVRNNTVSNVAGVYGGCNVIYCAGGVIEDNTVSGTTTSTIDANGILIDHACTAFTVRGNVMTNISGKSGVLNSGCGVMILDATTAKVYGNLIVSPRIGIYFGSNSPAGQSADCYGNTIISPSVYGVYVHASATRASITVKNSVFVGSVPLVYDSTTGGWTGEDYNAAYGMTASTAHTNGANNITSDPRLSSDYRPLPGSPLLGAGTHISYTRDCDGRQRNKPPAIGAFEPATLRAVLTTDPAA